ncbi:MAG: RES domain-containing protein [Hymenobacter sp.]|nr:MAG: RES domain-containing protein [Hymenobacter sp.]
MPQHVYRIQTQRFASTALSGEGARLYGGRWNPEGIPLVYTSASPELALLEVLVHLDGTPFSDLPPYVLITIAVPDAAIEIIAEADLPPDWQQQPAPTELASFLLPRLQPGNPSLGFSVPSVVFPNSPSRNVLLNPQHPLMPQVQIVSVAPIAFDERLRP